VFFIINKTKTEVIISDLKISLGPRQALDLDKFLDRKKSERSNDLSTAIKKGIISVRQKTNEESSLVIKQIKEEMNPREMDKFKKDINDEIKNQFSSLKEDLLNAKGFNNSNVDNSELLEKLADLIKNSKNSDAIVKSEEEEVLIDEDVLSSIHAKTVDRQIKDTKISNIEYEEKEVKNDIDENVDELENLLN